MGARKIYALYDNGVLIGDYTSREIAKEFNIPQTAIPNCANDGLLYRGRYTFEVVDEAVGITRKEPLLKEWDEVRMRILTAGR